MTETKPKVMTLANKITILRILLIPAIVIGLLLDRKPWMYILLGFSMLTDLLDGLAARSRKERTRLGAFLDPLADKLLLSSVYLTLTYLHIIHPWIFVLVFSRDLLIVLGWTVIYILTGSSKIQPQILGKITTALQMATALSYIIPSLAGLQIPLLWSSVAATIVSAVDYVIIGQKRLAGSE
jgi:cardiolipin synthase